MTYTPTPYEAENRTEDRRTTVRGLATAVLGRWPTYVGIALALLVVTDGTPTAAMIAAVAALTYLTTAVLDRPGAVWLVLVVLLLATKFAEAMDFSYWVLLGPVALAVAVIGLIRGPLRRPGLYRLQLPQMAAVAGLVLLAEFAGWDYAGLLVAAILFAHAAWDIAHWRADRVVPRSLAEFCAVFDALLGAGLVVMLVW